MKTNSKTYVIDNRSRILWVVDSQLVVITLDIQSESFFIRPY